MQLLSRQWTLCQIHTKDFHHTVDGWTSTLPHTLLKIYLTLLDKTIGCFWLALVCLVSESESFFDASRKVWKWIGAILYSPPPTPSLDPSQSSGWRGEFDKSGAWLWWLAEAEAEAVQNSHAGRHGLASSGRGSADFVIDWLLVFNWSWRAIWSHFGPSGASDQKRFCSLEFIQLKPPKTSPGPPKG